MMFRRLIPLVAVAALAVSATASVAAQHAPVRRLAITVNGQQLEAEPAARVVDGRVLVPFVRVFGALAIAITRDGDSLVAQAPNKTIRVTLGSRTAHADNKPFVLDSAPVEIDGTTFVPLRVLTEGLGASVTYDPRAERIEIVSSLVRRETSSQNVGGKTKITGTLTALDLNSQPSAMTVTYRGSVRTIAVNSSAKVFISDVVARTEQSGRLAELRVGDAVAITLNSDGNVETIVDMFGSRTGTVAAVSSSAIVLENGRVITPSRSTEISLNGTATTLDKIQVGDSVTQRMNPESGETRQIMASRKMPAATATAPSPEPGAPAATAPVAIATIASLAINPARPLKLGESFELTMRGSPGGRATFDLGTFITNQVMREESPGVYKASLRIEPGMNFTQAPVVGHLNVAGSDAKIDAPSQISVATIAPQITEVAPANGQVINNNRPSIYATFAAPTDVGINPSSISLKVNGSDVTSSATRTGSFVTYTSGVALNDGPVAVQVSVADLAGNTTSRSWTFTIRTR